MVLAGDGVMLMLNADAPCPCGMLEAGDSALFIQVLGPGVVGGAWLMIRSALLSFRAGLSASLEGEDDETDAPC